MNQIWTIAKREFLSYFNSPIAYVAITIFLVLTGLQFFFGFLSLGSLSHADFFENNDAGLRSLFEGLPLLLAIFLPAITMRLISEEKKSGTMELLLTMPVTDGQVVLGKYLASLLFLAVVLFVTLSYPITVSALGNPDSGPIIGGYFGLFIIGATYLAIGLMTSTWTQNQIVAFLLGALFCTAFYFVDSLIGSAWEGLRPVFAAISFKAHFQNISKGVLDSRDFVFFGGLIIMALLLSKHQLESRKWKA